MPLTIPTPAAHGGRAVDVSSRPVRRGEKKPGWSRGSTRPSGASGMTKEMIISSSAHKRGSNSRGRPGRRDLHRCARAAWLAISTRAGYRKSSPACSRRSLTRSRARRFPGRPDVVATFEEFDRLDTDEDPPRRRLRRGRLRRSPAPATVAPRDRERDKEDDLSREELPKGARDHRQVARAARDEGRAHVARDVPGRFFVFMPTVDHVGVSRKIDSRRARACAASAGSARARLLAASSSGRVGGGRPRKTSSPTELLPPRSGPRSAEADTSRAPPSSRAEPVGKLPRDLLTEVRRHPHRQRAGVLAGAGAGGAHQPSLAPKVKLYRRVSDLEERRQRRSTGRCGAGLAEVGRIDRDQPDRGARRHRRQHRALRGQEDGRPAGGHDFKTNLEAVKGSSARSGCATSAVSSSRLHR